MCSERAGTVQNGLHAAEPFGDLSWGIESEDPVLPPELTGEYRHASAFLLARTGRSPRDRTAGKQRPGIAVGAVDQEVRHVFPPNHLAIASDDTSRGRPSNVFMEAILQRASSPTSIVDRRLLGTTLPPERC